MADYRYVTSNVLTGAVLAELPLGKCSIERKLTGAGAFKGSLKMSDPRARAGWVEGYSTPAMTAITVLRQTTTGGPWTPIWSGPIWTRQYDVDNEEISYGAQEWSSYLARRKVVANLSWTNASLLSVVQQLVAHAQDPTRPGAIGGPGNAAQLNMTVSDPTGTASGVIATGGVLQADRKSVQDVLNDISAASTAGIDYRNVAVYTGNAVYPVLQIGTPLGSLNLQASVAEALGGTWDEDATNWDTFIVAAASGGSSANALVTALNLTSYLAQGWPELDDEVDPSITDMATLQSAAVAYANTKLPTAALSDVVVKSYDPDITTYDLGDTLPITFSPNARFPNGLSAHARVVATALTPGESTVAESVKLTLGVTNV